MIANNPGTDPELSKIKKNRLMSAQLFFYPLVTLAAFFWLCGEGWETGKTSFLPSDEEHRRECEGEKRWRRGGKKKRRKEEK